MAHAGAGSKDDGAKKTKTKKMIDGVTESGDARGGGNSQGGASSARPRLLHEAALVLTGAIDAAAAGAALRNPLAADLTPLPAFHVTLIGAAQMKASGLSSQLPKGPLALPPELVLLPVVVLGDCGLAQRGARRTFFAAAKDQAALHTFVRELCATVLELPHNPDAKRFFHVSLANNAKGNPFHSVSDITKADLQGK